MLRREQHRQEVKISSLKAINEQLNERLNQVGEEQDDLENLQN